MDETYSESVSESKSLTVELRLTVYTGLLGVEYAALGLMQSPNRSN